MIFLVSRKHHAANALAARYTLHTLSTRASYAEGSYHGVETNEEEQLSSAIASSYADCTHEVPLAPWQTAYKTQVF